MSFAPTSTSTPPNKRRRGSAHGRPGSTSPTPRRSRPRWTTSSPTPGGSTCPPQSGRCPQFNNAGITWGGDTELLTLDQWNAIIDVNIRGVAAAYPLMVRQGHGHIINTASMAGLTAAGQITSYVMTKHAVVGLTFFAALGGRCPRRRRAGGMPGRRRNPDPGPGGDRWVRRPGLLPDGQGVKTPYDADRLARDTLEAIGRNKAILVKPRHAHAAWLFARLAPGLMQGMAIRFTAQQRAGQQARTASSFREPG